MNYIFRLVQCPERSPGLEFRGLGGWGLGLMGFGVEGFGVEGFGVEIACIYIMQGS